MSLFLYLPEDVDSRSMPDNLPRATWWHDTFNCVTVLCLLTSDTFLRTHTQVGRWRWAERSRLTVEWSVTSKIGVRIYSDVRRKGFLCGEHKKDQGTEKLEECRVWLLLENFGTHTHTHTHTHTDTVLCLAPLPSGVSVSKWEPLSGAQWAWDSVHVMGSWLVVCACVYGKSVPGLCVGVGRLWRQRGVTANNRQGCWRHRDTVTDWPWHKVCHHTTHCAEHTPQGLTHLTLWHI